MSRINGQLMTCDKCGKQVFLRAIGEGETDGGYTRWNKFEPFPDGWSVEEGDLCPDCTKEYQEMLKGFWSNATNEKKRR
jgi:hypothetical protein